MAEIIVMPKAGISVESCIIGQWQKNIGDDVVLGDVLFNYETDKATFECESTAAGKLLATFYEDGDEVPVLTAVCVIGAEGEDYGDLVPKQNQEQEKEVVTEISPQQLETNNEIASSRVEEQEITINEADQKISPRAKQLAERLNVNAATAIATGPHNRVIARDIEKMAVVGTQEKRTVAKAGGQDVPAYQDEKFSKIRQTIAKAMQASLQNTAQLTHNHSFDASAILDLRAQLKKDGEQYGLSKVTIGDMIIYATARTLKKHPDLNAHLLEGNILRRFSGVHMGVAVDTPRGLMVPTIFNADQLSLLQISEKVKELASLCQTGSISPDLLQGGSFTVSNLGAVGVETFTPILNPPQVGIIGVCATTERARQGKTGIELYPAMSLSLTYDHRAVDGAPASRFARDLCHNLECFSLMLVAEGV